MWMKWPKLGCCTAGRPDGIDILPWCFIPGLFYGPSSPVSSAIGLPIGPNASMKVACCTFPVPGPLLYDLSSPIPTAIGLPTFLEVSSELFLLQFSGSGMVVWALIIDFHRHRPADRTTAKLFAHQLSFDSPAALFFRLQFCTRQLDASSDPYSFKRVSKFTHTPTALACLKERVHPRWILLTIISP